MEKQKCVYAPGPLPLKKWTMFFSYFQSGLTKQPLPNAFSSLLCATWAVRTGDTFSCHFLGVSSVPNCCGQEYFPWKSSRISERESIWEVTIKPSLCSTEEACAAPSAQACPSLPPCQAPNPTQFPLLVNSALLGWWCHFFFSLF